MNRFFKRNLEVDLESSQSNSDTDEILSTSGQKEMQKQ